MTPTWSIIHASRGRPAKAAAAMRMWRDRAAHPEDVQYVLCADADDETRFDLIKATRDIDLKGAFVEHPGTGSAPAWDFAAKFSTGWWLIQASDDVEPPERYDELLMAKVNEAGHLFDWMTRPIVIAVSDGYRKDRLMTVAVCNRAYYKLRGEFIHANFQSMYSDDDFTVNAMDLAERGECVIIDARDVVMKHQNPYHTGAPQDATLLRQNSPEAYRIGSELFAKRNGHLMKWRTWS